MKLLYSYCNGFGPFRSCQSGPGPLWSWIAGIAIVVVLVIAVSMWLDRR